MFALLCLCAWPVHAARQCAPPELDCKSPNACEMYSVILQKAAARAVFKDQKLLAKLTKIYEGKGITDPKAIKDAFEADAEKAIEKVDVPGCAPSSIDTNVAAHTGLDCRTVWEWTGASSGAGSKAQANGTNTCQEFVAASDNHEAVHRAKCLSSSSSARANRGLSDYAAEDVAGYDAELSSLYDAMNGTRGKCTPSPQSLKKAKQSLKSALKVLARAHAP
jgi:hypothetical protein